MAAVAVVVVRLRLEVMERLLAAPVVIQLEEPVLPPPVQVAIRLLAVGLAAAEWERCDCWYRWW